MRRPGHRPAGTTATAVKPTNRTITLTSLGSLESFVSVVSLRHRDRSNNFWSPLSWSSVWPREETELGNAFGLGCSNSVRLRFVFLLLGPFALGREFATGQCLSSLSRAAGGD
jgi:hypothetical protein